MDFRMAFPGGKKTISTDSLEDAGAQLANVVKALGYPTGLFGDLAPHAASRLQSNGGHYEYRVGYGRWVAVTEIA